MVSKESLTQNGLRWLESILRDRVSRALYLQFDQQGDIELRLPGDDVRVVVFESAAEHGSAPTGYTEVECEQFGLRDPLGRPLPLPLFGVQRDSTLVDASSDRCVVRGGIPWVIFWALTRIEERTAERDQFGRVPATQSHAHVNGYLARPFVDEWIDVIGQITQKLWPVLGRRESTYTVQPTHDVDYPSRYAYIMASQFIRAIGRDLLNSNDPRAALQGLWIRARASIPHTRLANEPYNTFEWLMEESEARGLRSTFYFMCGGRDRHDPGYDPRQPAIRSTIKRIHERGHTIGLHPSFGCVVNDGQLAHEANTLMAIADEEGIRQGEWGARMHYLRCRYPHTWRQFETIGLTHDATMGYADRIGFRAGTCFPYVAFDPEADRALSVQVRPLAVMEGTLNSPTYMNLQTMDDCVARVAEVESACRRVGGVLTLLWHNSEVATTAQRTMYRRVLDLGR